MLKVYDQNKNFTGYISEYMDACVEKELESGDQTLTFTLGTYDSTVLQNEYYIETEDAVYVVKSVDVSSKGLPEYECQLNLEELESYEHESFVALNMTLQDAANLAVAGTGWLVKTDILKVRSVGALKVTPYDALSKIKDAWMCEMQFDTKNKVVTFKEEFGEDKGVYFARQLNLKSIKCNTDSYDFYTRIIPIGNDDLRITDVNDGKDYVENYQYSDKIRTLIWEDTNYEDAEALKEDAVAKLEDMSVPKKSYDVDVVQLSALAKKTYNLTNENAVKIVTDSGLVLQAQAGAPYEVLDYDLGDTIKLIDEQTGIKEKQRIVKIKEYPQNPEKNSCELSNTVLTFEEMQKKLDAAASALDEITNSDGTVNGYYVHGVEADGIVGIETTINNSSAVKSINNSITTINGNVESAFARIGTLETTTLKATDADLKYATIDFSNIGKAAMEYFYAKSGLIQNVVVGDATITGDLVGVTISGDLIEGNTIKAEKLVIKGSDGLYYKLNTDGVTTTAEQTDYNSLNGTVLQAKTVTAEKISVNDLVAFDATIGGFNITDSALYSGVKESINNTTRGVYLDSSGQMNVGDPVNHIKYYKDTSGNYRLEILADSLKLTGGKTLNGVVNTESTYQKSTSGTDIPEIWRQDIPELSDGEYLWTKVVYVLTDGSTTDPVYTVAKQGDKGDPGSDATLYQIEASANMIKTDKNGYPREPSCVTFSAYKTAGSNIRHSFTGTFVVRFLAKDGYDSNVLQHSNVSSFDLWFWSVLVDADGSALLISDNDSATVLAVDTLQDPAVTAIQCQLFESDELGAELAQITIEKTVDTSLLTQEEMFNILTNNGEAQGLYLDKDDKGITQLYISFSYAKGGSLTLGGSNDNNGAIDVYDSSGRRIMHVGNEGLQQYARSGWGTEAIVLNNAIMYGYIMASGENVWTKVSQIDLCAETASAESESGRIRDIAITSIVGGVRIESQSYYVILTSKMQIQLKAETFLRNIAGTYIYNTAGAQINNTAGTYIYNTAKSYIKNVVTGESGYISNIAPTSIDCTAGTFYQAKAGTDIILSATNGIYLKSTNGAINLQSAAAFSVAPKMYNLTHVSSGGHLVFAADGWTLAYLSSSSKQYKDIKRDMSDEDCKNLYAIQPVIAKYKDGYLAEDDALCGAYMPMFIAEDVKEHFPEATRNNSNGEVEDWNFRVMIPAMFQMIKSQKAQIDSLTERIEKLELLIKEEN